MGLRKFIVKNAPGCIGGVAKTQAKVFKYLQETCPYYAKEHLLDRVLESRIQTWPEHMKKSFSEQERIKLITMCEGKLFNLIMAIILIEYPEYKSYFSQNPIVYSEVSEIVYETIQKYAPGED